MGTVMQVHLEGKALLRQKKACKSEAPKLDQQDLEPAALTEGRNEKRLPRITKLKYGKCKVEAVEWILKKRPRPDRQRFRGMNKNAPTELKTNGKDHKADQREDSASQGTKDDLQDSDTSIENTSFESSSYSSPSDNISSIPFSENISSTTSSRQTSLTDTSQTFTNNTVSFEDESMQDASSNTHPQKLPQRQGPTSLPPSLADLEIDILPTLDQMSSRCRRDSTIILMSIEETEAIIVMKKYTSASTIASVQELCEAHSVEIEPRMTGDSLNNCLMIILRLYMYALWTEADLAILRTVVPLQMVGSRNPRKLTMAGLEARRLFKIVLAVFRRIMLAGTYNDEDMRGFMASLKEEQTENAEFHEGIDFDILEKFTESVSRTVRRILGTEGSDLKGDMSGDDVQVPVNVEIMVDLERINSVIRWRYPEK